MREGGGDSDLLMGLDLNNPQLYKSDTSSSSDEDSDGDFPLFSFVLDEALVFENEEDSDDEGSTAAISDDHLLKMKDLHIKSNDDLVMKDLFSKVCDCNKCTENSAAVDQEWIKYYHTEPPTIDSLINKMGVKKKLEKDCPRVLETLMRFDAGEYRQADGKIRRSRGEDDGTENEQLYDGDDDDGVETSSNESAASDDNEQEEGGLQLFDNANVPSDYIVICNPAYMKIMKTEGLWDGHEYLYDLGLKYLPEYHDIREAEGILAKRAEGKIGGKMREKYDPNKSGKDANGHQWKGSRLNGMLTVSIVLFHSCSYSSQFN